MFAPGSVICKHALRLSSVQANLSSSFVKTIFESKPAFKTRPALDTSRGVRCYASVGKGADNIVHISPVFKVPEENLEEFKNNIINGLYPLVLNEPDCIYYNFVRNGNEFHCREAYYGAKAALHHLDNVGVPLGKALELAELTKLDIYGPSEELEQLKEPLKDLNARYFEQL
mmetsp:Transcript_32755/g.45468  ORF Transcript_32755/g.45468 Transcript_32755/m.45468 type:complete len:172 (-) Transcript_32755:148-663(-)|eukprot:CAMPEP_0196578832 /NCGR_PEP_ID=MMETSP1081-20130531/9612_1 /TAXON_ID=36882 /ORGANISM="Pyramimonas amylifera, Strain CCMP720" /LENGTH=171 /DNA_ID=CAMNT_0041898181 /DNA_START=88 /DNA_END=603 /DNA_ORIENTATION=+